MNNKALKTLEYTKIIEMLAAHASSPLGKIRCEDLLPSCSLGEIEYKQEQTQDALSRLFQKGNINWRSEVPSVSPNFCRSVPFWTTPPG